MEDFVDLNFVVVLKEILIFFESCFFLFFYDVEFFIFLESCFDLLIVDIL